MLPRSHGFIKMREEVEQVMEQWTIGLLEYLAQKSGCTYLSDLRYLSQWEQFRLSREIARIPAAAFSLSIWNDALDYLTSLPPEPCASDAREALIQSLSERRYVL